MKPLLRVKNLSISLKKAIVRDVSFELFEGETLGICGESGSGKSMMVKSILQLLPPQAFTEGTIEWEERDLLKCTQKEMNQIRGQKISMIFQDPMSSLNPTMKIGNQIVEGYCKHYSVSRDEARAKALELLHLVGIPEPHQRIDTYPHTLSGGMRQRVMIALALSCNPQILIADEITTALDVTIQAMILTLLKDLQKRFKMSIIIISHNLSILASLCDRILVLYDGEIAESAQVDELFYAPKHPYTQELLRAIPRIDMPKDKPLVLLKPREEMHSAKGCRFCNRCPLAMPICRKKTPPMIAFENQTARCWLYDTDLEKKKEFEHASP